MITRSAHLATLVLLLSAPAVLAQSVAPPPPQPANNGPTLAATMQFIQNKMQERAKLNVAVYTHDNATGQDYSDQYSGVATNIVADPATCRISYHRNIKKNGTVVTDVDVAFNLHDVQDVVVMPAEQNWKRIYADAGHPSWEPKFDPPMFLAMTRVSGNLVEGYNFADEETADRIAKALVHAIELCGGGGSKDPF